MRMNYFMPLLSSGSPVVLFLFVVFLIWIMIWKGLALWIAARNGNKGWFIALLIVNTAGLLEILYIYAFSKKAKKGKAKNIEDKEEQKIKS